LVAAGVSRVVAACRDPNPIVNGQGIARLRAAGITVELGVREAEATRMNRAFFHRVTRGRPHVTLKTAMTLDGKIAAWDGASRWITGEAARLEAHRMRFAADAILVGIGTVLRDDPALSVRLPGAPAKEPWRVVADTRLRTPPAARLVDAGDPGRALLACGEPPPAERQRALEARGARVLALPTVRDRLDLGALLLALGTLDVVSVLVEGGAELAAGLLDERLIDRVAFFLAPRLLGGSEAPGPIGGGGRHLKDTVNLTGLTYGQIGDDILIQGDVAP
jgi:diaminohydroxyphosphoribosylaminopyrimidine deaminase/5-amino-6-(5-phosphoribosylamino)uracil reductase